LTTQPSRVLPLREVEALVGLRKTALSSLIKRDEFPRPIKLTARRSGWLLAEVSEWLQHRAAARDEVRS
jgi:prophage regulatory protein